MTIAGARIGSAPRPASARANSPACCGRPRDQHAFAEKRRDVEPANVLAHLHDVADDHDGRRSDSRAFRFVADRRQRADAGTLRRARSVLDDGGGSRLGEPVRDQPARDRVEVAARHEENERPVRVRELAPIQRRGLLGGVFVPGCDRERRVVLPMRHRNAGVRRGGERRADSGNDVERNAGVAQRLAPLRRRVRKRTDRRPSNARRACRSSPDAP